MKRKGDGNKTQVIFDRISRTKEAILFYFFYFCFVSWFLKILYWNEIDSIANDSASSNLSFCLYNFKLFSLTYLRLSPLHSLFPCLSSFPFLRSSDTRDFFFNLIKRFKKKHISKIFYYKNSNFHNAYASPAELLFCMTTNQRKYIFTDSIN